VKGIDALIAALEERRFVMVLVRTFESFTMISAPHAIRILSLAESLDIGIISILGSLDLRSRIGRLVAYTGILVAARVAVLRATRRAARRPAAGHPPDVRTRHVQR